MPAGGYSGYSGYLTRFLGVLFRRNRVVLCYSGKIAGFYAFIRILCSLCFCCEKLDYRKKMGIFAGE